MNFAFSDEQEQLRDAVRKFLEAKSPSTEVRRLMETTEGYDPAVWSQMANELGLQGLHIPEEYGGQGFTFVELGIVLEEMGRALLCAPYFSSMCLGANAILNAGTEDQKAALLPGIAAGETIATLAVTEPAGRWDASGITMEASGSGDTYTLTGTKSFVIDGHTATTVVVVARQPGSAGEDGIAFFVVDGDAAGLTRTPLATMDMTRKQARLDFDGVAAAPLGAVGAGWPALSKTFDQVAVALANEGVGGAQACLDMAVEYAKVRVQFGRPIGSFQAIKHKCADMLLEVESGKSAAYYASWAAAEDNDELPVVASLAKAYVSDAYFHAAGENIQIHGGIGFTWEHDAHLYFKRAKSSETLFGDASYHRELLAQRIGIQRLLHALYAAGALLLVIGGAFKLVDPSGTVGALRALRVRANTVSVRVLAGVELVLGAAALAESSRRVAVLVAISYAVFAGFAILALARRVPIDTCGCLGRLETPPSWRHLVVIAAVLVSAVAEALDPADAFLQQLGDDADDVASAVVAIGLCAIAIVMMRSGRRPSTPR